MNDAATGLAAAWLLAFACAALATGQPMDGNDGFDAAALDPATKPGDDFFRYVNGSWLDRQTIPADNTGVTRRIEMSDRIEVRLLGWAQAWCGKMTDDFVRRQVVSDPHSPHALRVNGVVRNMDAWYAAFAVNPGDRLYLAPEERVVIW
jgi:predicted metalloendopeptidase